MVTHPVSAVSRGLLNLSYKSSHYLLCQTLHTHTFKVVELLVQNLGTDGDINAMLAAAALANVLAKHHYSR